jgi:molybdenum cofactor cytidylyltransferase
MKSVQANVPLKVRVSGVVLAAGQSKRIGKTKQLLEFRGSTLLEQVIAHARRSLLDEIIVVLGHDASEIRRQVDLEGVQVVLNENYQQGQSSSLRVGLNHVSNRSHAVMFLLGDQPLVDECMIDTILSAYREYLKPIVIPVCAGRRGNPVIIGRELFGELMATAEGDAGARVLFERHAAVIQHVEMASSFIHVDVDTIEDYSSLMGIIKDGG